MSPIDPTSTSLEFPKPPSTDKQASNCAATLAWLKTNIATIYSAGRTTSPQEHYPALARSAYLGMYSTVHSFCMDAKQRSPPAGPLDGEDLYRGLKNEIKTHCSETRTLFIASRDSAEVNGARQIIGEYLAHWRMLARLAALVKNLMQPLERNWIARSISEERKGIVLIVDLHMAVWKHEILQVGIESTEATTGSKLQRALKKLQAQGEDGNESDKDLTERFVEYVASIHNGLSGVATLLHDPSVVLVADAAQGVLWRVHTATGDYAVAMNDLTSKPTNAVPLGVNGSHILNNELYFTNLATNSVGKETITADGSSASAIQILTIQALAADDFALSDDGIVYAAGANTLWQVSADGHTAAFVGNPSSTVLQGVTSARFGRTAVDKDVVYMSTQGGLLKDPPGPTIHGGQLLPVNVNAIESYGAEI